MHSKAYLYKRIVEAKLFIDEHYAEAIDLDKIADTAHYSKYYFLRLFKEAFGKSPYRYLSHVRMHHAKRLLKSQKTVADVCVEVGFDSVPSFSTLFKKHTGTSPADYRETELKKLQEIKDQPFRYIPGCFAESYNWKNSNSQ